MNKICEQCGATFVSDSTRRRFCAPACIKKAYNDRQAAKRPIITLVCAHCNQPFTARDKNSRYKYCSATCSRRAYQRDNREKLRTLTEKACHGHPKSELRQELWSIQEGKCYLCEQPIADKTGTIDHDHRCCRPGRSCENCRRGLACQACNVLIGRANDDPAQLRRIADNLEKALARVIPYPRKNGETLA